MLRNLLSPNVPLVLDALPEHNKYGALNVLQNLFFHNVLLVLNTLPERDKCGALPVLNEYDTLNMHNIPCAHKPLSHMDLPYCTWNTPVPKGWTECLPCYRHTTKIQEGPATMTTTSRRRAGQRSCPPG